MISKFLKFASGVALVAILGFGDDVQSKENNNMAPGMIVGIGGDIGFAIHKNSDFKLQDTWTGDSTKAIPFPAFSQKHDSSTGGGNAKFGYLMENGIEGTAEVGYRQITFKDKHNGGQSMESHVLTGMINATYYVDLGGMIYPYVSAGVGVGRSNVKGTMVAPMDANAGNTNLKTNDAIVKFDDMKAYRLTYQAGVGISTVLQSAIIGVGYKFFGVAKMKDSKDYSDITANVEPKSATGEALGSAAVPTLLGTTTESTGELDFTSSSKFKFNKFNQNIHTVEAFIKMVM